MKHIFTFLQLAIFCVSCANQQRGKNSNLSLNDFSSKTFIVATDKPFKSEIKGELKMLFDDDSTGRYRIIKGGSMLNIEFKWRVKGDSLQIDSINRRNEKIKKNKADYETVLFSVIKERNGYLLNSSSSQLHLTSNELSLENIDYKNAFEIIELFIKCAAILLGGCWIYFKFRRTRENHPKIQFDLDARFLVRQDNRIVIELFALLSNKGTVRHFIRNFTFDLYVLKEDDKVENGGKDINYQIKFTKANPLEDPIKSDKTTGLVMNWIPTEWTQRFVDPYVDNRITYLTSVPGDTSLICVYSRFDTKKGEVQSAMRTFSINELENKKELKKEFKSERKFKPQKIKIISAL